VELRSWQVVLRAERSSSHHQRCFKILSVRKTILEGSLVTMIAIHEASNPKQVHPFFCFLRSAAFLLRTFAAALEAFVAMFLRRGSWGSSAMMSVNGLRGSELHIHKKMAPGTLSLREPFGSSQGFNSSSYIADWRGEALTNAPAGFS
jgi:hypothetical protein